MSDERRLIERLRDMLDEGARALPAEPPPFGMRTLSNSDGPGPGRRWVPLAVAAAAVVVIGAAVLLTITRDDDERVAGVVPGDATDAVGRSPRIFVAPDGLDLGPDSRSPDTVPGGELVAGQLSVEAGCVVLDGSSLRLPIWPAGTTWNADANVVVLPDGTELPTGATVEAVGNVSSPPASIAPGESPGSTVRPLGHAEQLIGLLPGLGACMSATGADSVAYELSAISITEPIGPPEELYAVATEVVRLTPTVLETKDSGPMLCVGAIASSYPPQCSGPAITNWDWSTVESNSANHVRWAEDVELVGRFSADGARFTMTEPIRQLGRPTSSDADVDAMFSTPCPEPEGGWNSPAIAAQPTPSSLPPQAPDITGLLQQLAGYGGSWWDDEVGVYNVRIAGGSDAEADAATELAERYNGPVCIIPTPHTEAALRAIQQEIGESYSGAPWNFLSGVGVMTNARTAAVTVILAAPMPGLEAALAERYGDAVQFERFYEMVAERD